MLARLRAKLTEVNRQEKGENIMIRKPLIVILVLAGAISLSACGEESECSIDEDCRHDQECLEKISWGSEVGSCEDVEGDDGS